MKAPQHNSTGSAKQDDDVRKPGAPDAGAAATDPTQPAASTSPAGGAANRGSPAAPVMKQFAKTKAEGTGRP
jgi:hypothetical protein